MVTSLDLVAEQLRVASGEPLSFTQDSVERRGHAIECRINAEDPSTGFLPYPGPITRLRLPGGPGVRWDGGYEEGDAVSQYYDNLIGKLVVWGPDREAARRRMLRALDELVVEGVRTTTPAHRVLLAQPEFAAGTHSTKWVEDELDASLFASNAPVEPSTEAPTAEPTVERTVPVEVDGRRYSVKVWLPELPAGSGGGAAATAPRRTARARAGAGAAGDGTIASPMQGTIVKVLVAEGDTVEAGQAVLVLEAMKMENQVNATLAGTVREVRVEAGATVGAGDVLMVIE